MKKLVYELQMTDWVKSMNFNIGKTTVEDLILITQNHKLFLTLIELY